jgi:CPA1 family monovalent cation:H+ antiporter
VRIRVLTTTPAFADVELLGVGLLLVAAVVAIAARYLRLPYTVALVVAGLCFSFLRRLDVSLSRDLIFLVFLPPLVFEAGINTDMAELRRRWSEVTVLTIGGTLITAGAAVAALALLTDLPFRYAVLLGTMLAPTDPVSVLATMKDHRVSGGLRTLLEGESIFNDALGVVLFGIALSVAFGGQGHEGWASGTADFFRQTAVGLVVGGAGGLAVHRLMQAIDDHLVEITLSVTLAFGTFLIADRLGGSGIVAVVVAALLITNYGPHRTMAPSSRRLMLDVWEVVAFLLNSALFLLIGLQFHASRFTDPATIGVTVVAALAILAGRALSIYGLFLPFRRLSRAPRAPVAWMHALFWGGLRGSIPVALALGLTSSQRDLAGVDAVAVVFGVVMLSLLVQGLTFGPLLARLGFTTRAEPIARV